MIERADFFVSGSEPQSSDPTDVDQATVTVFIEASEVGDPSGNMYQIQTTVTQRTLDI